MIWLRRALLLAITLLLICVALLAVYRMRSLPELIHGLERARM